MNSTSDAQVDGDAEILEPFYLDKTPIYVQVIL
jgi:hypothetical protein